MQSVEGKLNEMFAPKVEDKKPKKAVKRRVADRVGAAQKKGTSKKVRSKKERGAAEKKKD